MTTLEGSELLFSNEFAGFVLYSVLVKALSVGGNANYPKLTALVARVAASKHFAAASEKLNAKAAKAPAAKKDKAAKKEKSAGVSAPSAPVTFDDIVVPTVGDVDWASAGLVSSPPLCAPGSLSHTSSVFSCPLCGFFSPPP